VGVLEGTTQIGNVTCVQDFVASALEGRTLVVANRAGNCL
jgi:hypothetical protein